MGTGVILYRKQFRSHGGKAGVRRRRTGAPGRARGVRALRAAGRADPRARRSRRSRAWCGRACSKCWRPRRSAWRRRARISGAAAAAIISTRRTNTSWTPKRAILVEELRRLGKIEPPAEIAVVSASRWAIATACSCTCEENRLGYREARSHKLCAVDRVPDRRRPRSMRRSRALVAMQRDRRWPRFMRSLEVFTDEQQVQINVLETERPVARRFFDWCAEQIPGVVEGALDYRGRVPREQQLVFPGEPIPDRPAGGGGARGRGGRDGARSVCGRGAVLAAAGAAVPRGDGGGIGRAARCAICSSTRSAPGWTNLQREQQTAEEHLAQLEKAPDFVLLDPPRAGLGKAVVERLTRIAPAGDHDRGLRPGDAGARSGGAGGGAATRSSG